MYEGDAPLAERRAQALTLDRDLLRELLGQEELRELLDPEALADLELSLQALVDERHANDPDQVHDLLRRLGDLSTDEVGARTAGGRPEASLHLAELAASRRAVRARIGGEERWIAMEDVARYRDGVGVAAPPGVPQAFLGPAVGALDGLLARYARTHGPFLGAEPARRWGLPGRRGRGRAPPAGRRGLACSAGEFRPGRRRARVLRSRGPAAPAPPVAGASSGARSSPSTRSRWRGSCRPGRASRRRRRRGSAIPAPAAAAPAALERLAEVVDQLAGLPIPASVLERDVLPARVPGYQPRLLDELGRDGRGRLGGAREPRPRRRPGRPVPAGPRAAAADRAARRRRTARRTRSTSGSGRTSGGAAPRSTASCSRRRAGGRTARCSTRCGTSSGRAR